MSEQIETIDSGRMEILSEFLGAADDSGSAEIVSYRIGVLGDDFIIASQSLIAKKPQGKVIPEDADDRTKAVFENGIRRDWWGGDIVFGLKNFDAVLERLEEIYGLRPPRKIGLNEPEIKNGKDLAGVRMNSVMPHSVGRPIVSLQLTNHRLVNLDGIENSGWHQYMLPEAGERLMKEMQKIQPIVRSKIETSE